MALTLKETLQTGAIVVGTYFGVLAITKMMTPDKNISEVAEKSEKDWDAVVPTWIATVPNLITANQILCLGMK